MTYQITKEINIHHEEDGWFYQFNTDEYGTVEVSYYELRDGKETQVGKSFHIPKDCIETFISVLQELK
jgi:hypothetical protein